MASEVWLPLNEDERNLILLALTSYARGGNHQAARALSRKIATAAPDPAITGGGHGGLVKGARGNAFPIRICNYDGSDEDLHDMDERWHRSAILFEPADEDPKAHLKKRD